MAEMGPEVVTKVGGMTQVQGNLEVRGQGLGGLVMAGDRDSLGQLQPGQSEQVYSQNATAQPAID